MVETEHFRIDLAAKQVITRDGDAIRLTSTEWQTIEVLARNAGKLIAPRQLLHVVWGPGYSEESNHLRVHMAHVRRKLEPDPGRPRYLLTEPGMGYRFVARTAD